MVHPLETKFRLCNDRVGPMRVDIILPTLTGRKNITLASLKKLRGLLDYRLILIRDVYNLSKAYNLGVRQANSDIIALLDDDLEFEPEDFMFLLSRVRKGKCILDLATKIMYRSDYISVGGFEERYFRLYQEDTEFLHRLSAKGIKFEKHVLITHLGGAFAWWKALLIRFNYPMIDFKYAPKSLFKDFVRGLFVLNPMRFVTNLSFLLGMAYYPFRLSFGKRSDFESRKSLALART
jgi:glycosyltransferase involved in cell wall biosynthesis